MHSRFGALVLGLLLITVGAAAAPPSVGDLADRLRRGEDFRVRVQAALELGKTADPDALDPLVGALDDPNASVRAAAAAALGELGDPDAVPALKSHRLDRSENVRKQIKVTLATFAAAAENGGPPARLLVKIGSMKNQTPAKVAKIEAELENQSRKKLDELPGVEVLAPSADSNKEAEKKNLPVVMVSGQIQKLRASREGSEIVYSASVEYILHTMPDQSIAARVSGSASGTLTQEEASDESRASELRHQVLDAAIASALRRAPRALLAAARL
ncbi:MAG TPA: HEAT repeat domain-containing protein [Polyangiaceae bacterium]